jgi:uncharacterized protein
VAELRNASTGATLSHCVERAVTPWQRTLGFLLTARIEPERGLWFAGCRAIHTIGMRSAVDVVFLNRRGHVVAVKAAVPPNQPFVWSRGAQTILEMGPGFLQEQHIGVGDHLELA